VSMSSDVLNERKDKKVFRKSLSWNIPLAVKRRGDSTEGVLAKEEPAIKYDATSLENSGNISYSTDTFPAPISTAENSVIPGFIGNSPLMSSIFQIIKKVAKTSSSILITGESGTGKELVARAVHNNSVSGPSSPFIAINCGAMPAGLMESELFGHEKGAFTDASARKIGKAELAKGGTLFLDEISTMPLNLQVKLLRFLQDRTITRLGGNTEVKVDIRVIAAANTNLREAVKRGEFREDLFYRLNVIPIVLPPLRDRGADISLLAKFFLCKYSRKYSRPRTILTVEALKALEDYSWHGNVRELENIMERLVVLAPDDGLISRAALPIEVLSAINEMPVVSKGFIRQSAPDFKEAVRAFERSYITALLCETGWNRLETARIMKVHRNTLLMKMKILHISSEKVDRPLPHSRVKRVS